MPEIPDSHRDLLHATVATFATIGPDGRPQQTVVWFHEDGDTVALSLSASRQKTKNLVARPQCSLLIIDPNSPMRYLELRGDAEITADEDYAFAEQVGLKYSANLRDYDAPGDARLKVRIVLSRVNAVDMRG
ncbi:MAG TPA: PPOX class F420-dependent oxidoreductase [Acidimicrobiales bacterium]|nr:PPOX class F420-dependent oxidoreductase [Acidimicrobiales bacterium]